MKQDQLPLSVDLAQIHGQAHVKRALEVAAAGGYNVVLAGAPNIGKAMLARALSGLLPCPDAVLYEPQAEDEDFTLPDRGVVFLRDLHFWHIRDLTRFWQVYTRQPSEMRQLVASIWPCPCGYYGDLVMECRCSAREIVAYQCRRVPFLSDFSIFVEVQNLKPSDLLDKRLSTCSEFVRERVIACGGKRGIPVSLDQVEETMHFNANAQKILNAIIQQIHLTPRSFLQFLQVARTIANLAGSESVDAFHLAEAVQYRSRFRR